jgi:hypothetical protein
MNGKPQINRLYVFDGALPMFKKVSQKETSILGTPLNRFAQNKTLSGKEKVFLMLSEETDIKKIAKFFKQAHKQLKNDDHAQDQLSFTRATYKPIALNFVYQGDKS